MFIKSLVQPARYLLPNVKESLKFTRKMSVLVKSLKYSKHGEPVEVMEIVEGQLQQPKDNEVLVKVLAAPINPADINTIQGNLLTSRHNFIYISLIIIKIHFIKNNKNNNY